MCRLERGAARHVKPLSVSHLWFEETKMEYARIELAVVLHGNRSKWIESSNASSSAAVMCASRSFVSSSLSLAFVVLLPGRPRVVLEPRRGLTGIYRANLAWVPDLHQSKQTQEEHDRSDALMN